MKLRHKWILLKSKENSLKKKSKPKIMNLPEKLELESQNWTVKLMKIRNLDLNLKVCRESLLLLDSNSLLLRNKSILDFRLGMKRFLRNLRM